MVGLGWRPQLGVPMLGAEGKPLQGPVGTGWGTSPFPAQQLLHTHVLPELALPRSLPEQKRALSSVSGPWTWPGPGYTLANSWEENKSLFLMPQKGHG